MATSLNPDHEFESLIQFYTNKWGKPNKQAYETARHFFDLGRGHLHNVQLPAITAGAALARLESVEFSKVGSIQARKSLSIECGSQPIFVKCECGADVCGHPVHSRWCPKAEK